MHIYAENCPVYANSQIIGLYTDAGAEVHVKADGTYQDFFNRTTYKAKDGVLPIPAGEYRARMLRRM